jgi:hypothetical protein
MYLLMMLITHCGNIMQVIFVVSTLLPTFHISFILRHRLDDRCYIVSINFQLRLPRFLQVVLDCTIIYILLSV